METKTVFRTLRRMRRANVLLSLSIILLLAVTLVLPPPASQAAPASQQVQAITIKEYEESDFSPNLKASYGETITYTIRYTITTGTNVTGVSLQDSFGNQTNYLKVAYVDGSSVGPVPMTPQTPDVPDVVPTVDPRNGQPLLTWALPDINNNTGNTWVYEVRYRVNVYWDNNTNTNRQAISTSTLAWSGGSVSAPPVTVSLVQPANFTFNKAQDPPTNVELNPGDAVTWTLSLQNPTGDTQGTAYDLYITDTMPVRTIFQGCTGGCSVTGTLAFWYIPSLPVGGSTSVNLYATIPLTQNVAHAPIQNVARLLRSSAPGDVPTERVYRPPLERTTTAYLRNISIGKYQISPVYTGNNPYRATAGEFVTITVAFTVPQGIILYNPTLRILLEDGLKYIQMISPIDPPNIITSTGAMDPWRPSGYWTQLEWANLDSITNTDSGPVVVTYRLLAQARQNYFAPGHSGEVPHGTSLRIVPIVRWSDDPSEEPSDSDTILRQRNDACNAGTSNCVQFIRPDLRYQSSTSGSYFTHAFPGGSFQGGATVRLTLHLRNRSETVTHPTAYETVLTDTLSAGLTYVSASPAPDSVSPGPGGTILRWNTIPPIDPPPDEEVFVITATLPLTMPAGTSFTTTAQARYTTFPGSVPDEGDYLDTPYTVQYVFTGGYAVTKSASTPHANNDIYIADVASYTVVLTLNPGLVMYGPEFSDTLPLGGRYITDSLAVDGASLIGSPWVTNLANGRFVLHWRLSDVDNTGGITPQQVTMTYRARQSGRNAFDQNVYAGGRNDFTGRLEAKNTIGECWRAGSSPSAPRYCLASPYPEAETYVIQPWMGDAANFAHTRTDLPKYNYEVGETVHYRVDIKNTGRATAYDVVVTETLPQGLAIQESWVTADPTVPTVTLVYEPPQGSTGVVSWTLDQIAPNQTARLYYDVIIQATADACSQVVATVNLGDYTSQPGDPPYDRHYRWFDGAYGANPDPIPAPQPAPYITVLGVCLTKSDSPDPVNPGDPLAYRIDFGNTSALYGATHVRITDTYDANTTFANYTPSDPTRIYLVGHYTPTRTIVFGIDSLPAGGTGHEYYIDLNFTVGRPFDQNYRTLVNHAAIDGQGDLIGRVERTEETEVLLPYLLITQTAFPSAVAPGDPITYTLLVRNLGTRVANNVRVDTTYDPHVNFESATPPPTSGNNHWDIASLGIGGEATIVIRVRLDRPVPYDLTEVVNQARVASDEVRTVEALPVSTGIIKPGLLLSTADSQDPVAPGGAFAYTVRYTNTATAATSVVLTDTMDPYVNYNYASPTPTSCQGNTCRWNLGTLNPGQAGQVAIFVIVKGDIPSQVCSLVNRAYIASAEVTARQDVEYTAVQGCTPGGYTIYLPLVFRGY